MREAFAWLAMDAMRTPIPAVRPGGVPAGKVRAGRPVIRSRCAGGPGKKAQRSGRHSARGWTVSVKGGPMYTKILHAGRGDMDFNALMRNTAYLDKAADVRLDGSSCRHASWWHRRRR